MQTIEKVEMQLRAIGRSMRFWGRTEMRELTQVLMPDEEIAECVNGRYENGFGMLCVTDKRTLLVDKKPLFLMLEDIRFDMITELDYGQQAFMSSLRVVTPGRKLIFSTWDQSRLRNALDYIQLQVTKVRQGQRQNAAQEFSDYPVMQSMVAPTLPSVGYIALSNRQSSPFHHAPLIRKRVPKFSLPATR